MQWSNGKQAQQTQQSQTCTLLGIDGAAEKIAGFLYFGYPALVLPAPSRKLLAKVTRLLI